MSGAHTQRLVGVVWSNCSRSRSYAARHAGGRGAGAAGEAW
jgi:hypothetical protein